MCFTWCSLLNRKFSWFNWICIYFYLLLLAHSDLVSSFQSSVLHSQPKSTVGTPAYIAPEVLLKKEYDGKVMLWLSHFLPQVTRCCIYASICRSILWCVSRLRFFFSLFRLYRRCISDCRRVVMWGDFICHVGWCIPLWGPRGPKKLPQNNSGK